MSSAANTTFNIFEVVALCAANKLSIEPRFIKDDKGVALQRWFLNRAGARGGLLITLGDCTREGEEPAYEPTFLGRKPERHPDSPPDCTTKGALTIIPNAAEGAAWVQFNRWLKGEILRVGAIKDKKNQVVTSMEKLESEFKDIIVEPEAGNDARPNVCLWQKFQIGSEHVDLNTKFQYISCVKNARGNKVLTRGSDFDPEILKAGTPVYSVLSIGPELKRAPPGWGIAMYTRQVFIDTPSESDGSETVIVFGGVKMSAGEDAVAAEAIDATAASILPAAPEDMGAASEPTSDTAESLVAALPTEAVAVAVAAEAAVAGSEGEVVSGISSDISDLAKTLAKFNDADRVETKRQRRA